MLTLKEYTEFDAIGLGKLVKNKELSARELLEVAIDAIEQVNPELNAVVVRMYTEAREVSEQPLPQGPLSGVPFLLKDLLASYKGVRLTSACRFYADYIPDHDSELVKRYRAAGLVTFGKTNCPEMGIVATTESELHGPAHTPWKLGHTSGGSSGGAGAAVGARVVPMAHGGDGGGSIRIPASCCGVFGFKPSRGRVPTGPDASQHWGGFVVEHALTKTVRDSAALLDASTGASVDDWYITEPPERPFLKETTKKARKERLRIAFTKKPFLPGETHNDCREAVDEAAKLCESLGHTVEETTLKLDPKAFARDFLTVVCVSTTAEIAAGEVSLGRKASKRDFERTTWLLNMLGKQVSGPEYVSALARLQAVARDIARQSQEFDVLLCPTLGLPPVRHGELSPQGLEGVAQRAVVEGNLSPLLRIPGLVDQMAEKVFSFACFTPVANVTGQPSMSVPLHWNSDGLPIGTMFTARLGQDATLFRLAAELEEAKPWADRTPPTCVA